jgi:hypothetical protein
MISSSQMLPVCKVLSNTSRSVALVSPSIIATGGSLPRATRSDGRSSGTAAYFRSAFFAADGKRSVQQRAGIDACVLATANYLSDAVARHSDDLSLRYDWHSLGRVLLDAKQ